MRLWIAFRRWLGRLPLYDIETEQERQARLEREQAIQLARLSALGVQIDVSVRVHGYDDGGETTHGDSGQP